MEKVFVKFIKGENSIKKVLCCRDYENLRRDEKVLYNGEELTLDNFDTWFGKWDFKERSVAPVDYSKAFLFKIIGKISSGAIWLKDGDIIKEENMRFTASYFPPFEGDVVYKYEDWVNMNEDVVMVKHIQVKCLNCETFH